MREKFADKVRRPLGKSGRSLEHSQTHSKKAASVKDNARLSDRKSGESTWNLHERIWSLPSIVCKASNGEGILVKLEFDPSNA